jgi:hypothetical protein
MSADCSCPVPALDCPCCCKHKAVIQGLLNRVSGYECYLKNFLVPASCQGLSNATTYADIIEGNHHEYRLSLVHGGLSNVNMWNPVGCRCVFRNYPQPLYRANADCWGHVPMAGGNSLQYFTEFLKENYSQTNPTIVEDVSELINGNSFDTVRLDVIRGAVDWTTEIRKVYGSILMTLPC